MYVFSSAHRCEPLNTLASVVLYECMTRFVLPLCDHVPHEPPTSVSTVMTIIDLADVSLTAMWSLRSHLQQASTMATANYPETLDTIAIVNSPSFFPTVWNWVKVRVEVKYSVVKHEF